MVGTKDYLVIFTNNSVPESCCIHPKTDACTSASENANGGGDNAEIFQTVSMIQNVCVAVFLSLQLLCSLGKLCNIIICNVSSAMFQLQGCFNATISGFKNNLGAIAGGGIVLGLIQVNITL